jgi:hypothetical protein
MDYGEASAFSFSGELRVVAVGSQMEPLQNMQSQELRIIGRVVSFSADLDTGGQRRTCAFKGWVGHITKDTVTLIDAIRFDDVAELHDPQRTAEVEMEKYPLSLHHDASGPSPVGTAPRALSSPSHGAGRLPYATFPRRKLRNVKFETDYPLLAASRSQEIEPFLDAARSPAWFPHDAQKVRMFVRRYIVHAEKHVSDVSLRSFLSMCLSLPEANIDLALVHSYMEEEIADLLAVDREIASRSDEHRDQQHHLVLTPPLDRNNRITNHHLIIKLVHVILSVATVELVCATALVTYAASLFEAINDRFLLEFIQPALVASLSVGGVFVAASLCTFGHMLCGGATAALPFWKFALRALMILFCLFGGANSFTKHVRYCFVYMDPTGTHLVDIYRDRTLHHGNEICRIFQDYRCSGWDTPCGNGTMSYVASSGTECPFPSCAAHFPRPCRPILQGHVLHHCLPLLVLTAVASLLAVLEGVLLIRLRQRISRPTVEPEIEEQR